MADFEERDANVQRLAATLALAGWRFEAPRPPNNPYWRAVSPIGEGYMCNLTWDETVASIWRAWESSQQAMWTGRPLSDFPEYNGGAHDGA